MALFLFSFINQPQAQSTINNTESETAIQNAVLFHINQYRQQHHLEPLKMNPVMVKEARQHSLDMANHRIPFGHKYFSHRISTIYSQIKEGVAASENVAYNYKNAQIVVKNWLLSPGHKKNIDGPYNLTGVGVIRDTQGKLYFTQIFLRTESQNKTFKRVKQNSFSNSLSLPFKLDFKKLI